MDVQAKARYSALRENDWETLGYYEIPYFRQYEPELEGDIHPIFQHTVRGRPDSSPIWLLFSQQDYQNPLLNLGPVFRLAAKLLLSSRILDLFYWLIYSLPTAAEPLLWSLEERVSQYCCDDISGLIDG